MGLALALGTLCCGVSAAQPQAAVSTSNAASTGLGLGIPPRVLVSPTSDLDPVNGLPAISDAGLPMVGGVDQPSAHFVDVHWQGTAGFVPTDVDAVTRVPGAVPGSAESLAFSILSNEGGVKDGDVVVFDGAGGLRPLVTEETLLAALGRSDADIDVDGLAYDDAGLLLFSLQSDLDNTTVGSVEDGDILRLEASGVASRLLSEAEIQARFTTATGSTGAIGDVNGIDWVLGEPWVTTQGPSTWDGAIIAVGAAPIVLVDEVLAGLEGAELDAISYARIGDEIPAFSMDVSAAAAGDVFRAVFVGPPSSVQLVMFSGATTVASAPNAGGWGSLYVDPNDAWFLQSFGDFGMSIVPLDASGRFGVDYTLPTAALYGVGFGGEEGWSFQTLDVATLALSAPGRILRL